MPINSWGWLKNNPSGPFNLEYFLSPLMQAAGESVRKRQLLNLTLCIGVCMKNNRIAHYAVLFVIAGFVLSLATYFLVIYILQKSYNPYFVENNYTFYYYPFILFALIITLIKGVFDAKKTSFSYLVILCLLTSISVAMYFPERIAYKEYFVSEKKYRIPTSYMPEFYYQNSNLVGFTFRVKNLNFDPAWPDAKNTFSKLINLKVATANIFSEAIKSDVKKRMILKEWFYSRSDGEELHVLTIGEYLFLLKFSGGELIRCQKEYENCTLYIQQDNGILYSLYIHGKISFGDVHEMLKLSDRIKNKIASFEMSI